ncbi:MAG TPA: PEP-CTERM sorting domain-containing protein, partial [Pirellulaceae bacterium]
RIGLVALCLGYCTGSASAAFHLWDIREVYTNASGSVQFIELFTTSNSQEFLAGQTITTGAHTFTFPGNSPAPTMNRSLLLATAGFTALAGVTPNFTIISQFFNPAGDTINFAGGFDIVTFASAPTDGVRSLNYPGAVVALNSPTNFAGTTGYVRPTGDFNGDGSFGCPDVDALVGQIVAGTNNAAFDMTLDGFVNSGDLSSWRAAAGQANLPSMNPYIPGDANLDSRVDGSDFGIWNTNKFTNVAAWCSGDFNADGVVDGSDFGIWNVNKFTSADGGVVPEPTSLVLILIGAVWIFLAPPRRAI